MKLPTLLMKYHFTLLVLLLIIQLGCSQASGQSQQGQCQRGSQLQIFPPEGYNSSQISPRVCYANCDFCQVSNGVCQQCYFPYFIKVLDGRCQINPNYTLQSSTNQLTVGQGFTPSRSWGNQRVRQCNRNPNFNLRVLGLFGNQVVQYRRTLSQHNYFTVKFQVIAVNWRTGSNLKIKISSITQQVQQTLCQRILSFSSTVPRERICSQAAVDQRYSVEYQVQDIDSEIVRIQFTGNTADQGDNNTFWAINTFLVISGQCHPNCQDCEFSPNSNACISCKNFHVLGSDKTCDACPTGFRSQVAQGGLINCLKCDIEFEICDNSTVCFYRTVVSDLNNSTCLINNATSNYNDIKFLDRITFSDTLFTVNGNLNIQRCGLYSFVGRGGSGSIITRIVANTIKHIGISISFNFLVIDFNPTTRVSQNQSFSIYIDGILVQAYSIQLNATSNVCGQRTLQEVFMTFQPTRFFLHNSTQNVNISVSSRAQRWGIRDLRIVYRTCDQNCRNCSASLSCITCKDLFTLVNGICARCLIGSRNTTNLTGQSDIDTCLKCTDPNCLNCDIDFRICLQCFQGYFVFRNECQRQPDVGSPIFSPIPESGIWQFTPNNFSNSCSISFLNIVQPVKFFIVQDKLIGKFDVPNILVNTKVQFRLIKVDNWNQNQFLDMYLNDLRVMHKNFINVGNYICFNQNQNEQVSFQEYVIQSNNATIRVQFEVVRNNSSSPRKFGVADFVVLPFGCSECSNYGFEFKVDYNYNQLLFIQVSFNRVYINNDPESFKQIFQLRINQQIVPYQLVSNDSIRYLLRTASVTRELINTDLRVICLYPEKVVTNVAQPVVNQSRFFDVQSSQASLISVNQPRLLQNSTIAPQNSKFLDSKQARTSVQRFSPAAPLYGKVYAAEGLRIFFEVLSRIVIYVGFASFIIGCQTPFTHLMHNFQKIWVHIYVASLAIHPLLKTALQGFRQTQGQNIAIYPDSWEVGIPKYLYYDIPLQYQQYYHDITFFRNIYSVGIAFAALLFVYAIWNLIIRFWKSKPRALTTSKFYRHMKISFLKRPFFYFNSIIFYQYFTVVLACALQFLDLTSSTNVQPFITLNAIAAIAAFVFATVYPIIHFIYLKYKMGVMYDQIDGVTRFKNRYSQIFFRFLPKTLWAKFTDQQQIGYKQILYSLLRFGQLWWFSLVVTLMYRSPFAQAFLLMITNAIHFIILLFGDLNYSRFFMILKLLQLLFFIGLEILLLVSTSLIETIETSSYETVAIVGVIFIFIIVFLSFIRTLYTAYRIYREYDQADQLNGKDIDQQQLRNTRYFDSIDTQTDTHNDQQKEK